MSAVSSQQSADPLTNNNGANGISDMAGAGITTWEECCNGRAQREAAEIQITSGGNLFRRLLLALGLGEALGFFPAPCSFPHIISSVAVSHNS